MPDNRLYERMLTTDDLSLWLGFAPRTIRLWAECSELPAIKVGRQWRFRRADILLWLDQSHGSHATSVAVGVRAS